MTVIPNLGMRVSADHLERAAMDVPPEDRSAIAFIGRLSKDKGAALLPALVAMLPPHSLRVFGDGYLGADLRDSLGSALRGYVTQDRLAGVLQWARAVVFPSMWPEPGGIAGIDAQLFGVPLGAFEMGAAKDWPKAALFAPGDTGDLGGWAGTQSQLNQPRDAADIACRQDRYWRSVALRASDGLTAFSATGRFPQLEMEAVREELRSAISLPSPLWGTSSSRRY
jgi:hypothetical protein